MRRVVILVVVCAAGFIGARATLETIVALPRIVAQAEAFGGW